jgi:hypothetical protein
MKNTNIQKKSVARSFLFFFTVMIGLAMTALHSPLAQAGLLYQYSQLMLKDLDQMDKIIREKIKEAKKTRGDKVIPLKEALQAVYSRPNEDGMVEKVVGSLKHELDELENYEDVIRELVTEAVGALKNPRAFGPVVQVTYVVFLENILAEFKPKADSKFESEIIKQIRDAKIEVTKEAKKERKLRVMKDLSSPSDIAAGILPVETPKDKK